jgi:probable selenate reductase FAD-binding subunit
MITQFFKPETAEEAVKLKNKFKKNGVFYAGGTEINSLEFMYPQTQAICTGFPGMSRIEKSGSEIYIGASVTMQELIDSALIPEILKKASKYMVNRNIRNMATIGGNIGANRSYSNLIPSLIALKAHLKIFTTGGENITDIYKYTGSDEDDLITDIIIPDQSNRAVEAEQFTRTSNDLPVIGAAVSFEISGSVLKDVRIALGGVDRHIIRLIKVEEMLEGAGLPDKKTIEENVRKNISPRDNIRGSAEYKSYLAGAMTADCIYSAYKKECKI